MMSRIGLWIVAIAASLGNWPANGQVPDVPLAQKSWIETRTAHFNIYSCGRPQEIYRLATQLEQFSDAYALLAGAQALASPPIVVLAFPDQQSMTPFLPLYHDRPASLAGFFKRGNDENLIVLALPGSESAFTGMEVILHEYAHLLFRHNSKLWPLWLNEGLAEIYSTFEANGYTVRIAKPIVPYLRLLNREPMLPLSKLFAVAPDSPQYNERERQGIFYAESWLLTHFLISGGSAAYQSRFGEFTRLLRLGQLPEQAFTNALRTSLGAVEAQLRRYLENGRFEPIQWSLSVNLSYQKAADTRVLTPVETYYRLGDELMRIGRFEEAHGYFSQALQCAPASPLGYQGLGLLAAEREQHSEALRELNEALLRRSGSFLAHYVYAREKFRLTADGKENYQTLPNNEAEPIRNELLNSIALMPSFGPAHHLLGFLEMLQGRDLALAKQHLEAAIQLEPENPAYLIALAQTQIRAGDPKGARRSLDPLFLPNADPKLRARAEELLRKIDQPRS